MKAMSLRRRDTGELLFHFTLEPIEIPDEDVFYDARLWGAYGDSETDDILEWLYDLAVMGSDGNELTMDDGDVYIEGLAHVFDFTTMYMSEVVDNPDAVTGDAPPVPV